MSKIGIKFVDGGKIFNIDTPDFEIKNEDKVVVETIRGLEIGIVTTPTKDDTQEEIKSLVRIATAEDIAKAQELERGEAKVRKITNELIGKYKLDMKLVSVSFTLDGSKVIINYICEDRVDFRELVKDLAGQLKLRIELRQIGIRDQAKILGGIGFCGKECCCKKYLNDFDKVSIKMAKTQGLSLNPTKISGICGRLMCCLSYENELYAEISGKMPKMGGRVRTPDGEGSVVYNNILKQLVTVRIEGDNEIKVNEYPLADIVSIPKTNTPPPKKEDKGVANVTKSNEDKELKEKTIQKDKNIEGKNNQPFERKNKNNKFNKFKNKKKNRDNETKK